MNEQNSPPTTVAEYQAIEARRKAEWDRLREVAFRQRRAIIAWAVPILIVIATVVLALVVPKGTALALLADSIVPVFVASRLWLTYEGWRWARVLRLYPAPLWGALFIPEGIGLIILLVMNGRAGRLLSANGMSIGLFGGRVPEQVPPSWVPR